MTTRIIVERQTPADRDTLAPVEVEEVHEERPSTLVWIDAREAILIHWKDGQTRLERMVSDVPAHHRGTGHGRHDPTLHDGGGRPGTTGEPHRLEHLARFIGLVAGRLPEGDALLILGQGTARQRLEHLVRENDEHHGHARTISCRPAPRLSDPRLIERLHRFAGVPTRRRTTGPDRRSAPQSRSASGRVLPHPRRVIDRPQSRPEGDDW